MSTTRYTLSFLILFSALFNYFCQFGCNITFLVYWYYGIYLMSTAEIDLFSGINLVE